MTSEAQPDETGSINIQSTIGKHFAVSIPSTEYRVQPVWEASASAAALLAGLQPTRQKTISTVLPPAPIGAWELGTGGNATGKRNAK